MFGKIEECEEEFNKMVLKYHQMKIPHETEKKLREAYNKPDTFPVDIVKFLTELNIEGKTFTEMIIETTETEERAYIIYKLNKEMLIDLTSLCGLYGVSGGYFRELRRKNKTSWEKQIVEDNDRRFMCAVAEANDPTIPDSYWTNSNTGENNRHELMIDRVG